MRKTGSWHFFIPLLNAKENLNFAKVDERGTTRAFGGSFKKLKIIRELCNIRLKRMRGKDIAIPEGG